MNSRLKPVKTIDDKIRNHKNYKFIKVSYEDIMALFNEKVSKIIWILRIYLFRDETI